MKYGFTLMELMIALIIVVIIVVVALPQYQRTVERFHAMEGQVYLEQVTKAEQFRFLQNGEYTTDFEDLDIEVNKESYQ